MLLVGACVGSFLNVVILRLPEGLSIVRPRSRCPRCLTPIAWYDNLPLVSYLWLRGRCRHCACRIPLRYLLIEVLTTLLFGALYVRLGWSFELLFWLPLAAALLALAFLDIHHFWVPDVITFPAMAWALLGSMIPGRLGILAALAGLAPAVMLVAVAWGFKLVTHREGMGAGDIKLMAALGLAVGLRDGMSLILWAATQGTFVGLGLLLGAQAQPTAKATSLFDDGWTPPPRAMPFGPMLVLATYEIVLYPDVFVVWPGRLIALIAGWPQ